MSNALEAASLIMYPSGYGDGTLASVKPVDGTGDFTFTRGSNLSATRVALNSYIEKGYENLLLQSNTFDTTWDSASTANVTPNQQGYDGSNNAWKLISTDRSTTRIAQTISANNLNTISIYAKAAEWNYVGLYAAGANKGVMWSLVDGSVAERIVSLPDIYGDGESIGNGWWRFSMTYNSSSTDVRIYTSSVPLYNGAGGDGVSGIYIQDAMLNQGLVAYPYIETTTAPVAGGILEDEPRIDFSDGCGHLLLEPNRTNLITNSEYFGAYVLESGATLDSTLYESPEGLNNAYKLNFTPTGGQITHPIKYTGEHCFSVWLKGDTEGLVGIRAAQGTPSVTEFVNVTTEWQRFNIVVTDGRFWQVFGNSTTLSSVYIYGYQIEQGSYPTSYIPTYGVSQTRLRDVQAELTIPNGNVSEGTIFYEFDKAQAPTSYQIVPLMIGSNRMLRISQYNPNMRFAINENATSYDEPNTYNSNVKVAVSYSGSVVKLFINGNLRATDNTYSGSGNVIVPVNGLQVTQLNCSLESKQLLYFPTALSDDECIALTTI